MSFKIVIQKTFFENFSHDKLFHFLLYEVVLNEWAVPPYTSLLFGMERIVHVKIRTKLGQVK